MRNPYPKDVFKWDNPEELNFNRGRFNQHCFEVWENCKDELIKLIDEEFEKQRKTTWDEDSEHSDNPIHQSDFIAWHKEIKFRIEGKDTPEPQHAPKEGDKNGN